MTGLLLAILWWRTTAFDHADEFSLAGLVLSGGIAVTTGAGLAIVAAMVWYRRWMMQPGGKPVAAREGSVGGSIAILAGGLGLVIGVVLTLVLWNLTGPDDPEEAPIGLLIRIGVIVVPVCFWASVVTAIAWYLRRTHD